MIIDVHYHLIPALSKSGARRVSGHVVHAANHLMGKTVDPEEIADIAAETWPDPSGDRLLSAMEKSGVDFTVICIVDNIDNKTTPESVQEDNKIAADIAQKYPKQVMALGGIDPRRPEAPDMMRQCLEEFGMKGLKYHPDYGYDPCSPESYKVLDVLARTDGILLTHTGPLAPPSRAKYAEPALLADLAVDFPDLKVIGAHMGYINWRPWAALALEQPNLYGDLAMWVSFAIGHYERFCRELRAIIDYAGINKVLFGTDDPIYNTIVPTKEWIRILKDLPDNAPEGIDFMPGEIDAILGGNAAELLGLS